MMAWKYDPKKATKCFPAGEYQASIEDSEEGVSKSSGNPMLTITYKIYGPDGDMKMWDYITDKMTWKLKKIAQALGHEATFASGQFDISRHYGESIVLELDIDDDEYGEKNVIKKYKPYAGRGGGKSVPAPVGPSGSGGVKSAVSDGDEDIPFNM